MGRRHSTEASTEDMELLLLKAVPYWIIYDAEIIEGIGKTKVVREKQAKRLRHRQYKVN